jgi:hypothetical protein
MTLVATTFAAAAVWVQTTTLAPTPQDVREILRSGDAAAISAWLNQDPSAAKRPDAEGFQPIHWAAFFGKREAVELLIARGADPGASCRLGTALHAATLAGHVDIVRWLTARGVDPNATAEEIPPPLAIAVRRGNLPLVEALLEAGASPRLADPIGNSPLLLASSSGLEAAVRLLLAKGADVNEPNRRGATPLDVARREGHVAIIALLEERGAKGHPPPPAPVGPYLGQKPPGSVPALFAPELVSTERRELNAVFTPDGREFLFARERTPRGTVILTSRLEGERWTRLATASFSGGPASDVDMFVTHDGRDLYFCSDRPDPKASALGERAAAGPAPQSDIWVVSRTESGWGEPTSLGAVVNSDRDDYYPTLTLDGTLYFSSNRAGSLGQNDVYRARRRDGRWTAPENLGAPVNTAGREYDPFIAADESYLIFASERPGGFGGADLYLSVHEPDGSWGEPRNLGPAINTAESEYTPMLSPDGKYLFFTRGRQGYDDLYWVEAEVLRDLRRP